MTTGTTPRYRAADLRAFAAALARAVGLPADKAATMAAILVEADMMGRSTHGIEHMGHWYLPDLERDVMTKAGDVAIVADHGAALALDGRYLPGTWTVTRAMALGFERLERHPVVTIAVRDSHHVGFHAAFLRRATERGLVMILLDTNPYFEAVAPASGIKPVFSPTPVAYGFPTAGDPILVDFALASTSLTSVERANRLGERLKGKWLIDHEGRASDDPKALLGQPKGSILPLGGADRGHKGYGLFFMVYALAAGLSGFGTPASPRGFASAVFLQLIDPARFAGRAAFEREIDVIVEACHASPAAPGGEPVRVPGERAMKTYRDSEANGVALFPTVLKTLKPWAEKLKVAIPAPISG
ncbi:MAG: Ldh family oxidoreductase [Alphaproteobacteria bacterium]|nr:Ldh family oxidoreductase [Alphaproteobacteria bacterium]